MEMDANIRERWLAKMADEDNYPQGTNRLRWPARELKDSDKDTFCCFGVLYECAVEDGKAHYDYMLGAYVWDEDPETSARFYPAEALLDWAGIDLDVLEDQSIVDHLANMNDNGSNFAAISSEIRTHLA